MPKDEKFFDIRVADRYLKEGVISKQDHKDYIKSLPDAEDKSEVLIIEEEEADEEKEVEDGTEGTE